MAIDSVAMGFHLTYRAVVKQFKLTHNDLLNQLKGNALFFSFFSASEEYIPLKHATVTHETNLGRKENQTFNECQQSCRLHPRCYSFEIKLMCTNCKLYRCVLAYENYPEQQVSPNYFLWSVYLWNPSTL